MHRKILPVGLVSAAVALTVASAAWACAPAASLTVSPHQGPKGTQATIAASGYTPARPVNIYLYSQAGNRTRLATPTTDARGDFSTTVTIPDVPPGFYTVVGEQDGTPYEGRAAFEVTAPAPGPPPRTGDPSASEPAPTPAPTAAPAPPAPPPSPPPATPPAPPPAPPGPPQAQVAPFPAKLEIKRARVRRGERRLEVLAPITRRASGEVQVEFLAAGRSHRFTEEVDTDARRIAFNRRIPAAQARLGTGIVTITYPGDGDTRPQAVRLRAASQQAGLKMERPRIVDGRLKARGTISDRARGVVGLHMQYVVDGQTETVALRGRIDEGRWQIDEPLSPQMRGGIARRAGSVHANALFTGYFKRRLQGEMRSFQILGDP